MLRRIFKLQRSYNYIALNLHCKTKQAKAMEASSNTTLNERLPATITPTHYKLQLSPDVTSAYFNGTVQIDVVVKEKCSQLCVHTKFLKIDSVKVYKEGRDQRLEKYVEVKDAEQLVIYLKKPMNCGNYSVHISYSGDLIRNIVGFYLSHLKDKSPMVASKFQPTYARQAFPCFDEPEFKATFDISLVKPINYVALSNMNQISEEVSDDGKTATVSFATSVPMSTYLACFVICDFAFKKTMINAKGIGNDFELRCFAQKNEMHKINFAQDIGKRATEFYIQYYKVPFPLPKLDMIAIPDYVSGATEHWGLITYRETSFLVDGATASSKNKISVANTIAHELAHMWFGNLVTMKWWDEVWLNEGFASYMQVKALNALEPAWTMLDQFLVKTLHSVLVTDAKVSSHPIVQTVATPDQITAIFDAISYNKGASILRMLEGFIGEENFRLAVSDYLKKFKFGNTVTKDLLMSLEPYFKKKYPDLDLVYIIDTWTKQMGYPILNVKQCDEPNTFVVTQSRFLLDPDAIQKNDSEFNYRWFVPITYKTNQQEYNKTVWFPDSQNSVKIVIDKDEDWLKINNNQVGYYRVNYPIDMWVTLSQALMDKSDKLTISDRAHLLNDVFALAEARVVPYELALNLTTFLNKEKDYVPWEAAATIFNRLSDRLVNTESHNHLKKYVHNLIEPLYEQQKWEKSKLTVIQGLLRTRILSLAASFEYPDAGVKVRCLFLNWINHKEPEEIEPDLRDFVYYNAMRTAIESDWDKLWDIYLNEQDAQEQARLRRALAAPRDIHLLRKYLRLAWDERTIRSQDYLNVLQYISANPVGTYLVWKDVRNRWPQLIERFTLNSRYLGNLIPAITGAFDCPSLLQEMRDWFAEYPDAGAGESARRRALETVQNNIRWATYQAPSVRTWLKTNI